jgi:hypothetical protein
MQHGAWFPMLTVLAAACGGDGAVDIQGAARTSSGSQADAASADPLAEASDAAHQLWIVRGASTVRRDLAGLFQCLLTKSDFNDRAKAYAGGYELAWGGIIDGDCKAGEFDCAVHALNAAGIKVADHDLVMIIVRGRCGGDNNARDDGTKIGDIRVRGANVGECAKNPKEQERIAVHEAFEGVGDAVNADCCTGEVTKHCPDMQESLCPDCPCTCGRYHRDHSFGGYKLNCGTGTIYWSQRIPSSPAGEFNPDACEPFRLQ